MMWWGQVERRLAVGAVERGVGAVAQEGKCRRFVGRSTRGLPATAPMRHRATCNPRLAAQHSEALAEQKAAHEKLLQERLQEQERAHAMTLAAHKATAVQELKKAKKEHEDALKQARVEHQAQLLAQRDAHKKALSRYPRKGCATHDGGKGARHLRARSCI